MQLFFRRLVVVFAAISFRACTVHASDNSSESEDNLLTFNDEREKSKSNDPFNYLASPAVPWLAFRISRPAQSTTIQTKDETKEDFFCIPAQRKYINQKYASSDRRNEYKLDDKKEHFPKKDQMIRDAYLMCDYVIDRLFILNQVKILRRLDQSSLRMNSFRQAQKNSLMEEVSKYARIFEKTHEITYEGSMDELSQERIQALYSHFVHRFIVFEHTTKLHEESKLNLVDNFVPLFIKYTMLKGFQSIGMGEPDENNLARPFTKFLVCLYRLDPPAIIGWWFKDSLNNNNHSRKNCHWSSLLFEFSDKNDLSSTRILILRASQMLARRSLKRLGRSKKLKLLQDLSICWFNFLIEIRPNLVIWKKAIQDIQQKLWQEETSLQSMKNFMLRAIQNIVAGRKERIEVSGNPTHRDRYINDLYTQLSKISRKKQNASSRQKEFREASYLYYRNRQDPWFF